MDVARIRLLEKQTERSKASVIVVFCIKGGPIGLVVSASNFTGFPFYACARMFDELRAFAFVQKFELSIFRLEHFTRTRGLCYAIWQKRKV